METLNRVAFREIVEDDGEPCLVIFSRKSCHVCQAVHGKLDSLEGEYPDVPFYEVDVEAEPELQAKFGGDTPAETVKAMLLPGEVNLDD